MPEASPYRNKKTLLPGALKINILFSRYDR